MAWDQQRQLVSANAACRQRTYFCPACLAPVILKRGSLMSAHFAHQPGNDCDCFSEGETTEHLTGKRQLANWFARSGYTVQLEAPLTALHQRPDVLVTGPQAVPLALEFQCSPISTQRLLERTAGYFDHGYRVWWILGRPYQAGLHLHGKALKFLQASRAWGCYVTQLDVSTNCLRLCHHLLTLDGEPLRLQQQRFELATTDVRQLMHWHPVVDAFPTVATSALWDQHTWTLRHLKGTRRALQSYCYQHGGTLQQLPLWVLPVTAQPPLLRVPLLTWYVHVFVALRAQTGPLPTRQLLSLLWTTLRPLLASNACIRNVGRVQSGLVRRLINELTAAGVIVLTERGWQVVAGHLKWENQ